MKLRGFTRRSDGSLASKFTCDGTLRPGPIKMDQRGWSTCRAARLSVRPVGPIWKRGFVNHRHVSVPICMKHHSTSKVSASATAVLGRICRALSPGGSRMFSEPTGIHMPLHIMRLPDSRIGRVFTVGHYFESRTGSRRIAIPDPEVVFLHVEGYRLGSALEANPILERHACYDWRHRLSRSQRRRTHPIDRACKCLVAVGPNEPPGGRPRDGTADT